MKTELLNKWFDAIPLEYPPLERCAKRRRIDDSTEGVLKLFSNPPLPSISSRAHSDHFRPAYWPTASPLWKEHHNEGVKLYSDPNAVPCRYQDSTLRREPDSTGAYFRHTLHSIIPRLRRSKSESCLEEIKTVESTQIKDMPLSPPGSLFSAKSEGSPPSDGTTAKQSNLSKTRIDATNTNYRELVLEENGIVFKYHDDSLPAEVATVVDNILLKGTALEMEDIKVTKFCNTLDQIMLDAEADLSLEFIAMGILPPKLANTKVKHIQQLPFKGAILPRANIPKGTLTAIQTLCEPKPDITYSYILQSFTTAQRLTQKSIFEQVDLSRYCNLVKELLWSFFIVEFKALATGGNIFAAENQCAGSGSALVLAAKTLFAVALSTKGSNTTANSIAFSAAIDGGLTHLHVHWYDTKDKTYCLKKIHCYDLFRPDDVKKLHVHTKSIVDWAATSRFIKITTALDVIQEEHDRKNMTRSSNGIASIARVLSRILN